MDEKEFKPRICRHCGQEISELRDGREFILRCSCDWARAFHAQLVTTVHPDFYRNKLITILDWSPPIFKGGGPKVFKSLIKMQKVFAINRLYDFCFKMLENDKQTGEKVYSLEQSIARGRNLYIRGPAGSGRGTLMSSIKMFAAARGITATPNPGEWSTFKADILEAESWNRVGEDAKVRVGERYRDVGLLTLENLRGEGVSSFSSERKFQPKFRASTSIDDLLTKRQARAGSMIFTSPDFIRQMGDSVGDRLPELLESDRTTLILMFSPDEADALRTGLIRKTAAYYEKAAQFKVANEKEKKKSLQDMVHSEQALQELRDAIYFVDVFNEVPRPDGDEGMLSNDDGLIQELETRPDKWVRPAVEIWKRFEEDRETESLDYQEGVKRAYIAAVDETPTLASKMTEKERHETGKMMYYACKPKPQVEEMIQKAIDIRKKMVE